MIIEDLNEKNFKKFGRIIEYPARFYNRERKNLFKIIVREKRTLGWRIAYLIVRNKTIRRLEMHPESMESFEPVKGRCIIFVTDRKDDKSIRSFYLNKPVVLEKGIWHDVLTLDNEAEIKITENAKVKCRYWTLSGYEYYPE